MSNKGKLIGKVIADRYCITSNIGAGGMGQVYGAIPFEDPAQDVAIKVILRNRKLSYEDLLRFQKEATLMSRLHHPSIISFYELGLISEANSDISGSYYIVMEKASLRCQILLQKSNRGPLKAPQGSAFRSSLLVGIGQSTNRSPYQHVKQLMR